MKRKQVALVVVIVACNRSGTAIERAHVTTIGAIKGATGADGGALDGIEIVYDACPDVSDQVYFDASSPTARSLPASTVACLRGLGVGSKVDVVVATSRNLQTAGGIPTRIGSCDLPADFESNVALQGTSPKRCAWMR